MKRFLHAVILSFSLALNAKNVYSSDDDPLEPINRAIFGFNEVIDDAVLEPVAKGYRAITPDPVEESVTNFFNNLGEINLKQLESEMNDDVALVSIMLANNEIGIIISILEK